jgi:hypothetical protein
MRGCVCVLAAIGANTLVLGASFAEQAAPVGTANPSAHIRGTHQSPPSNNGKAVASHGLVSSTLSGKHGKPAKGDAAGPQGLTPTAPVGSAKNDKPMQRSAASPKGLGTKASPPVQKNAASINGSRMTLKGRSASTGASTGGVARSGASLNGTGMQSRN